MKIFISAASTNSNDMEHFVMTVGGRDIETDLIRTKDDELGLINFENGAFDAILSSCGLTRRFMEDYVKYRDGDKRLFPWDYGDHEVAKIDKALRMAGVDPNRFLNRIGGHNTSY